MKKTGNAATTATIHEQIQQIADRYDSPPHTQEELWAEIETLAQQGIAQRGRALTSEELTVAIRELTIA